MAEQFNTSEDAERLGQRLRNARENKGLTLLGVAKKIHVNHGQISRIERGKMVTLSKNVQKLCKFLAIHPSIGTQGPVRSHLGARIDALVSALPASTPAIGRLIDALEELMDIQG
jgi:transcriptional regulator with XRE-family HTH domain